MLEKLRSLGNALCIIGGLALIGYGLICLTSVDEIILSKYTPGARDSIGIPVLLLLLGGVAVLYGWINLAIGHGGSKAGGKV